MARLYCFVGTVGHIKKGQKLLQAATFFCIFATI